MMEQDSEIKISPERLKRFFTVLAITQKKISQKHSVKSDISERISKIKDLSAGAKQKSEVMGELERLERKVGEIVENQQKSTSQNAELMRKLQEKIETVRPSPSAKPFADFERISTRLAENSVKLGKIGETEERIEKEIAGEKSEINQIEQKLKLLEQKFNKLKSQKGTKKEDLVRLKNLIDSNKKILNEIKK